VHRYKLGAALRNMISKSNSNNASCDPKEGLKAFIIPTTLQTEKTYLSE
jgi:hypothetical protein